MKALEINEFAIEDGLEGDVHFTIDGYDNYGSAYLKREEAIQVRDWLIEFLAATAQDRQTHD